MDYQMIFTCVWLGLLFIIFRKPIAKLTMETLVKRFRKKKYTEGYQKFIEYWFLFGGIICLIFAIQEIFKK